MATKKKDGLLYLFTNSSPTIIYLRIDSEGRSGPLRMFPDPNSNAPQHQRPLSTSNSYSSCVTCSIASN